MLAAGSDFAAAFPSATSLLLEQISEIGERLVGGRWLFLAARRRLITVLIRHKIPGVLVVVTIQTQQLPVAAVGRVVVVVVVLVVDRKFTELLARELAPAMRADPGKKLQRSFPIGLFSQFLATPSLADDLVRPIDFWSGLL